MMQSPCWMKVFMEGPLQRLELENKRGATRRLWGSGQTGELRARVFVGAAPIDPGITEHQPRLDFHAVDFETFAGFGEYARLTFEVGVFKGVNEAGLSEQEPLVTSDSAIHDDDQRCVCDRR